MKKLLLATLITAACSTAYAEVNLDDEVENRSYSLGILLGENFTKRFGDVNFDALMEGLEQAHLGKETQVSVADAQANLQAYEQEAAAAASKEAAAAGEKFLADNKAREGVMVTDSGLQYEVVTLSLIHI